MGGFSAGIRRKQPVHQPPGIVAPGPWGASGRREVIGCSPTGQPPGRFPTGPDWLVVNRDHLKFGVLCPGWAMGWTPPGGIYVKVEVLNTT